MSVAVGKPYRTGNGLMARAKIGNPGGSGVSKFFPTRTGNSLVFRGANLDSKIVYGWPVRTGNSLTMRTIYQAAGGGGNCFTCSPLWPTRVSLVLAGFGLSQFVAPCNGANLAFYNGTYVLNGSNGFWSGNLGAITFNLACQLNGTQLYFRIAFSSGFNFSSIAQSEDPCGTGPIGKTYAKDPATPACWGLGTVQVTA